MGFHSDSNSITSIFALQGLFLLKFNVPVSAYTMSNFNLAPKVRGNFKGLHNSVATAAALVHSKPVLIFTLSGTVFVNENDQVVPELTDDARVESVLVDYHFRIDPRKLKPEHSNYIAAVRDRLQGAQRMVEKMAMAQGNVAIKKLTRADLPDVPILMDIYGEMDAAMDQRLLALVDTTDNGLTAWDYTDENGSPVMLTAELLKSDVRLADAMQSALGEWLNPTKASSEVATKETTDDGTKETEPQSPASLTQIP